MDYFTENDSLHLFTPSEFVLLKLIMIDYIVKLIGICPHSDYFLIFKLQGDASAKPISWAQDQKVFNQLLAKRPAGSKSSSLVSSKSPSTENPRQTCQLIMILHCGIIIILAMIIFLYTIVLMLSCDIKSSLHHR